MKLKRTKLTNISKKRAAPKRITTAKPPSLKSLRKRRRLI